MAVEVESGSQVEEFLRVLRRRSWWIGIPTVLVLALGSTFAVLVPKKYVAKTTVQVRNTLAGLPGANTQGIEEARNAPHHLKSGTRITQVLETLQWTDYLELNRTELEEYIDKIADNLRVELPPASERKDLQIVKISFAHTDPRRCFEFLEKASHLWRTEVLERSRTSQVQAYETLKTERIEKDGQRAEINDKLSELRQRFQLDPALQIGKNSFFAASDPAYLQVRQDQAVLEELATEIKALSLELERDKEHHDRQSPVTKRQLPGTAGISNREQIASLRLRLNELHSGMERYKKDHSKYRLAGQEITSVNAQIQLLEVGEEDPVAEEQDIPNPERLKLAEEIEREQRELAKLRDEHSLRLARVREGEQRISELTKVYRDMDDLERQKLTVDEEITTLNEELHRNKIAYQRLLGSEGNPFEILDEPRPPGRPTEPDPLLIVLFSLFGGLGLGLGLAVLSEYSKNCFRSVADISRVMAAPVLGAINTIATRRDRLRVRMAHGLVGTATLLVVCTLAFVTWAWKSKPEMLSSGLRETIEDLRENFK